MNCIEVDDYTMRMIQAYCAATGLSEADAVTRAVRVFADEHRYDAYTPVPVYLRVGTANVRADFIPVLEHVVVIDGPLAGQTFTDVTEAATAIRRALGVEEAENMDVRDAWHVVASERPLGVAYGSGEP